MHWVYFQLGSMLLNRKTHQNPMKEDCHCRMVFGVPDIPVWVPLSFAIRLPESPKNRAMDW
jgi:hypothetical protein